MDPAAEPVAPTRSTCESGSDDSSDGQDRDRTGTLLLGRSAMSLDEARALLAQMQANALVDEAEQSAHGVRHLTVEHGDPESADDEQRLHMLWQWAHDNRERARISTRGSNDTTTWFIDGPAAEHLVAEIEALTHRLNPGWWRIRRCAR
jgi:hypothetical protein